MKFKVIYIVGTSKREKNIHCNDLEEAEKIADSKFKNWMDIIYVDKSKAKLAH